MTKILDTVVCLRLQNGKTYLSEAVCALVFLHREWGKGRIYSDRSDQNFSQSLMSEMNYKSLKLSWNPWISMKIITIKNVHIMFQSHIWLVTCFKFNNSLQDSWKCMMIPKLLAMEMTYTYMARNSWPRYKTFWSILS